MLRRVAGYLLPRKEQSPKGSRELENLGYTVLRNVFSPRSLGPIRREIQDLFDCRPPDDRSRQDDSSFRYEIFNRAPRSQKLIGRREILDVVEPLLGEDCHVIANTAWRNRPSAPPHGGDIWHLDGGPHIPRSKDIPWPKDIPYPIFAIGCHIFLQDCPLASGPTGVIPGSHKSGRVPPFDRVMDDSLDYNGIGTKALTAKAGDVALFVSDVWHRRLPSRKGDPGRLFLQVHYGRRDIAQRVKPTQTMNHVDEDARQRIRSPRERLLLGLHPRGFYDG